MYAPMLRRRRGMTLVELIVVVAIIGLLAIAVAPLLRGASDKQKVSAAADQVTGHFNAAVAKSIGSRDGGGVWLETDAVGSGTGSRPDLAVSVLAYARPRAGTSGVAVITNSTFSPPEATLRFVAPAAPSLSALNQLLDNSLISFRGIPVQYRLLSTIDLTDPSNPTARIGMQGMYTAENATFPAVGTDLPFMLDMPPRRRSVATAAVLAGETCIDFSASSIGVYGFTPEEGITPLLKEFEPDAYVCKQLSIVFDGVGRPTSAWWSRSGSGAGSVESTLVWTRVPLDASKPIALLVGNRSQVGLGPVQTPSEDNPGPNFQSPDAMWVVIDPRSAVAMTVPNLHPPTARPTTTLEAQAPVAEALRNQFK